MIHNDIQNQLQLLVKTSAPPLIEVSSSALETPQWTPGQQIPAYVLASLPNGRFQVQVGDQTLDLNLPRNTQAGEQLELTYVSNTPRLTFALLRNLPSTEQITREQPGTPVSISNAAKFVGDLMQSVLAGKSTALAGAKLSAAAVLTNKPEDVPSFAQALRTSISQSGLFYESHQVQWLNGERTLMSLRQEPQGQFAPLPPQSTHADTATSLAPPSSTTSTDRIASENVVHPQAAPLIQQQLQALDTRQVIWQGQVWPGQQMNWAIEEDSSHQGEYGDDASPTWHTRLNLQLPTLGGVSAKLAFVNGTVQLDISAEDSSSATLMQQNMTALAERFENTGLQLSGVTIQHG